MAADRVRDSGVRVSCAGHFLARRGASTTSPRAPRQVLVPNLLLTRRGAGGAHVSAGATGRGVELRLPHQEMGGGSADVGAIHQQAYQHCVDLTIRPRQHRSERLRADSFACCTVLEAGCHVARAHLSKPPLGSTTEQRRCHAVDAVVVGHRADEARGRRRIRRRARSIRERARSTSGPRLAQVTSGSGSGSAGGSQRGGGFGSSLGVSGGSSGSGTGRGGRGGASGCGGSGGNVGMDMGSGGARTRPLSVPGCPGARVHG